MQKLMLLRGAKPCKVCGLEPDVPAGLRTVPLDYESRHGGLAGLRYWLRERRRMRAELVI